MADERLWNDPRFDQLPVRLDDMLLELHEAMRKQVDTMPETLAEARKAFGATHGVRTISEDVVPAMARVLNSRSPARCGGMRCNLLAQCLNPFVHGDQPPQNGTVGRPRASCRRQK